LSISDWGLKAAVSRAGVNAFWICDFGFWIERGGRAGIPGVSGQESKIQNPESKIISG
jgi:hypothetical protein